MKTILIASLVCYLNINIGATQNISSTVQGVWMNENLLSYYRNDHCDSISNLKFLPLYLVVNKAGKFTLEKRFEQNPTQGKLSLQKNKVYELSSGNQSIGTITLIDTNMAILRIGNRQVTLKKICENYSKFSLQAFLENSYFKDKIAFYKKEIKSKFNRKMLQFSFTEKMNMGKECIPIIVLSNPEGKNRSDSSRIVLGIKATNEGLTLYHKDHTVAYQVTK